MTPDSMVDDSPLDWAGWKPRNDDGRYLGPISLKRAFARSCNVCAARLTQQVGVKAVIKAARDLGISTPIPNEATISLGTSAVSLLELTAAYAAVADGHYPVHPHGVVDTHEASWIESITGRQAAIDGEVEQGMKALLDSSLNRGTGVEAALSVPAWGKTGTTQDGRDALFIGWAQDLVVGVWVGNDDNTPNPGLHGGGVPARLWSSFMAQALNVRTRSGAQAAARAEEAAAAADNSSDPVGGLIDGVDGELEGLGVKLKLGNGSISIGPAERDTPPAPRRDERRPEGERAGLGRRWRVPDQSRGQGSDEGNRDRFFAALHGGEFGRDRAGVVAGHEGEGDAALAPNAWQRERGAVAEIDVDQGAMRRAVGRDTVERPLRRRFGGKRADDDGAGPLQHGLKVVGEIIFVLDDEHTHPDERVAGRWARRPRSWVAAIGLEDAVAVRQRKFDAAVKAVGSQHHLATAI